jgi:hypothetical protein
MGMMKNYLLNVLQACSEQTFGQDAIEYAIQMGWVKLLYNLEADTKAIMEQYDDIIEGYQRVVRQNQELLEASYEPLMAAIELDTPEGRAKDRQLFPPYREAALFVSAF